MKIGIIGFSRYFRRAYAPYLRKHPEHTLGAICDILASDELEAVIKEAELSSIPTFAEFQEMLRQVDLEGVIISTPHIYHYSQVKACLLAGLHVFVDKPLACCYNDAAELVEMASSRNLKLAVANQRRYEAPYQYVRKQIQHAMFGEIKHINYLFSNSPWHNYSQHWRGDVTLNGGGAMMDIGYLAIDTLAWILDQPFQEVYASAHREGQFEYSAAILAKFAPNTLVNLTVSYLAPKPSVQEILSIYGTKGSIFTRRFQPKRSPSPPTVAEQYENGEFHEVSFVGDAENWRPLEDFLLAVENKTPIVCDGQSSLPTIQFIEAVYQAISESCIVYAKK